MAKNGITKNEIVARQLSKVDVSELKSHLRLGTNFKFRIIIIDICDVSSDYSDVFCQFNFLHRKNEAFSTEPIENNTKNPPLGFFHIQNVKKKYTINFMNSMKKY